QAPQVRPLQRRLRWSWDWPGILLMVAAAAVGTLLLLPPAYLLLRSVTADQAALDLLFRTNTLQALSRTVILAVTVTAASVVIAVPAAWLTVSTDLPGRRMWTVLASLPLVLPSFVVAYLAASILGPRGLLQQTLDGWFGIERLPDIYGWPGAFLVLTLMSYPYVLLSTRAALQRMDSSLVEAARSLGMSPLRAFWRVTLPQLRPAIVAGSLLVALYVLRDFGAVAMMRYSTFTRVIYIQYQSFLNRSLAAAMALVLVGMTAAVLYLELHTRGNAGYSRRSAGAARACRPVKLGRWRWPALAFMSSLVLVALIMPAAGLLYWFLRGAVEGQSLASLWQPAWSSVSISFMTAIITVMAALPVAVLSVRRPGRFSHLLERLTYAGYALPGIVIALALVFFGVSYARPFYQTLVLLLVAYMILFVPQATGAARTSLLQVSPSLEEAARSLGRRPLGVFRSVTLPLVRPGLAAGAALVFLTAMKELPATLILSPIGYRTLATSVWASVSEAFFAQAAAPALLLVILSSVPLALLTFREK
ncbi:MAG: iron ABC transporter permease, partial [Candidatus Promineifilaceae bacterium]|nr:iron ABC transporter permease [Candidatus Promineifilaceae bacterium]